VGAVPSGAVIESVLVLLLPALVTARLLTATDGTDPQRSPHVSNDPHALSEPRWITHRTTPGERLAHTAVRFGVTPQQLAQWNDLPRSRQRLPTGRSLKVHARRSPPERERVVYLVKPGDTWTEIAIAHRVDRRMLQAYNWHKKRLEPGDELKIWVDPGLPLTVNVDDGPAMPATIDVPPGGESIGRPQRGRIKDAVPLPERPWYSIRRPEWLWGSSHTILHVQLALASFRHRTGFEGEVVVGAISEERGGRFAPHQSHQSGRDVDVRLPLLPGLESRANPHPDEIDWSASWELVRAFLDTDEVQFIFLERKLQRRLYEAARWEGATHAELAALIDHVEARRTAPIRHARGHDGHIHVRFNCSPEETRCRG
jgi:murein endopeptidase/LysM repeat protein